MLVLKISHYKASTWNGDAYKCLCLIGLLLEVVMLVLSWPLFEAKEKTHLRGQGGRSSPVSRHASAGSCRSPQCSSPPSHAKQLKYVTGKCKFLFTRCTMLPLLTGEKGGKGGKAFPTFI